MMPALQVDIEDRPFGVRVHVTGEETLENTQAYWRQIVPRMDAAQGNGVLLIDELVGEPMSELEWLELVLSMEYARLGRFRIAHVKPNGLDEVEYCELFARDAKVDAKVFIDEVEAECWLQRPRLGAF